MKFDLQRFSDAQIFIRHNLAKYGFTVSDTGVSAPRLAIRHDDKDYYAALTSSADKPRLALYTGSETKYIGLSPKGTIVWLPFDESVTEDKCDNTWTTYGTPTIEDDVNAFSGKSLHLDGSSYLQLDGSVKLGGQDFTVDGWVTMDSSAANNDRIFQLATSKANQGTSGFIALMRASATTLKMYLPSKSGTTSTLTLTNRFHFAIVYQHATSSTAVYINGVKKLTLSSSLAATNWTFVYIGDTGSGSHCWNGSIEQFRIRQGIAVWTNDFTPPAYWSYFADYLSVWLPFTSSPTEDKCGNTWTVVDGTPTIEDDANAISGKSLYLDGSSYLRMNNSITLGGRDFTIDCWVNMSSDTEKDGRIFHVSSCYTGITLLQIVRYGTDLTYGLWRNSFAACSDNTGPWQVTNANVVGTHVHLEVDYIYSEKKLLVFINGQLDQTVTDCPKYLLSQFEVIIGAYSPGTRKMTGTIEHFRIYNGVVLHTENFTPPTAVDYA